VVVAYFEVLLSQHSPGETEKNHAKKPQSQQLVAQPRFKVSIS